MQKLEINTVALGMTIKNNLLGFPIFTSSFVSEKSIRKSLDTYKSVLVAKVGNAL
jgi:hypothetical protein